MRWSILSNHLRSLISVVCNYSQPNISCLGNDTRRGQNMHKTSTNTNLIENSEEILPKCLDGLECKKNLSVYTETLLSHSQLLCLINTFCFSRK